MALISKVNFTRFSRFGVNLGRLTYTAATHEEATDGTDELKITCDEDLAKGERLVWLDRQGVAHEHIVDEIERLHDADGKPYTRVTCINSINETWDDYIEDKRPSAALPWRSPQSSLAHVGKLATASSPVALRTPSTTSAFAKA